MDCFCSRLYSCINDGGIIHVAPIFNTPVAGVNLFPHLPTPAGRQSLYIPKLLTDLKSGNLANFSEIFHAKAFAWEPEYRVLWDHYQTFESHGFGILDNSPDEILDLCMDMEDKLLGIPADSEAIELQVMYKQRFLRDGPYDLDHMPDIGPRFAKKYQTLITAN